ncbi:hypothetical protein BU24DRAFT_366752 [Aaosphaeria arxii CBS 175.79]|uniref:SAGA-associated factor 11 n=1 Tax=Aaosphaeria arxii CBS 175.79 TaxID=1450172 RepID=A0A6A5XWZ2_9PLEO|nr:uncharacterized protein BU24DRAFT_366752 [Aaosphaeria arxii CBS 175.79]KAF2017160.1 hypothetical protein BU24DRAFT_366752 [Aaosphaeria arxii CBS 175.79]
MADNMKKRKTNGQPTGPSAKKPRFPLKQKPTIATMPTTTAYPGGELSVSKFLRAHENEIKALENGIKAAKKGLSRRAFQDVPREMRRRTGSHNPQRVPKRLRARAKREANDDNTPLHKDRSGSGIGKGNKQKWLRKESIDKAKKAREHREKRRAAGEANKVTVTSEMEGVEHSSLGAQSKGSSNKMSPVAGPSRKLRTKVLLAKPPTPPSRFRRRQLNKTWLPTHVWHAKRATMTPFKEPMWRFAIPLAPATKAYRLTHRAVTQRGAVAWDMSYIATIRLEGTEASISGLLQTLQFTTAESEDPWISDRRSKKWKSGSRAWEGWVHRRGGDSSSKVAPVTVIWDVPNAENETRRAFVRVHPSAFMQVWNRIVAASKIQKPIVKVEDLRFEIGSIEIMGPAAAETLSAVLKPGGASDEGIESPSSLWPLLAGVTDIGMLPNGAMLAFPVSDPRLRDPLTTSSISQTSEHENQLLQILATWPIDHTQGCPGIFHRDNRLAAGRSLPSQKSINRRKSAAPPGLCPEARPTDPQIPMMVYTSKRSKTWTVLLPWKCVMPVWRCLMRYPISSGGNPRLGGLLQRQQVEFERSEPSFPRDFPGTDAGWSWELQERQARQQDWVRRPKGKRIEWKTLDLGNGRKGEIGDPWACHWETLLPKRTQTAENPKNDADEFSSPFQYPTSQTAATILEDQSSSRIISSSPYLLTTSIRMVERGTPQTCARIYRLPTTDPDMRKRWLSLLPEPASKSQRPTGKRTNASLQSAISSKNARNKKLAANLLESMDSTDRVINANSPNYPIVPDEVDLIGFVTTGNYNLAEGRPCAIANLSIQKVMESVDLYDKDGLSPNKGHICIVREAGQALGSMSEDRAADGKTDGGAALGALSPGALADLTADVLEETVQNIIFNTALSCHRSEKLLRMQSAATQAESIALSTLEPSSQVKGSSSQSSVPTAETPAAKYENGQVYLKGNPLKTTPEIVCPHCKLPRLMHPIMGKGMQNPDLTREYCKLYPFVQQTGHDVYGNPFPTDMAKSKKERELIKQQQKNAEKESVGTPNSQDTDMAGGDTQGKEIKLNTGGKPASYVPWHTCPSCKRSLLITRFAQHLEKCLGISGRQSSRNAMAKLAGQNGTGTGAGNTPLGSRMGTPAPGSQAEGSSKVKSKGVSPVKKMPDDDDEGDNDTPDKKKKKKSSYIKKADRLSKDSGSLKVKLKTNSSKENLKNAERKGREGSAKPEKREREDNEDGAPKAKKIKLSMGKGDGRSPPPAASNADS